MEHFTSDLHFHHENILNFCPRPFSSVEEMNEALIQQWNEQVKPKDTVFHLGDFCFGKDKAENIEKIVKRLNGKIEFILGNHDQESHFENLLARFCNVRFVGHFKIISVNKKKITLCHYPMMLWKNSHHGSWSLHGHCHSSLEHPGRGLDVGYDNSIKVLGEYRFFNYGDLENYFKDREPWCPDHHNARTT